MKNKKFILKILYCVITVVIISSCFIINTFAIEPVQTFTIPIAVPSVTDSTGYIEIFYKNDSSGSVNAEVIVFNNFSDVSSSFNVIINKDNVRIGLLNYETQIVGYYYASTGSNGFLNAQQGYITDYFYSSTIVGFRVYGNFYIESTYTSNNYGNYAIEYGNYVNTNNLLESILAELRDNSQTDEIINGWNEDNSVNDSVDTTTVDNHNTLDKELASKNEVGISTANNIFKQFNLNGENAFNSLLAVTNIYNLFSNMGWLSYLISTALTLGLVAFVYGFVQYLGKGKK